MSETRCLVNLIHKDKSEARCIRHPEHQREDTDHIDEHGCHAPVLVTQATIKEVAYWQDVPFPWEVAQQHDPDLKENER